jgi:hypothetical protein
MFQEFSGIQYLKIDIANNFGLDKRTWNERIKWFDENEWQLSQLIEQAKEPALFYAGIKAFYDALAGRPSGYLISLDATSSGLQLLAALTCDRSASELCNVVDTGTRKDAYQTIYQSMVKTIKDTSKISHDDVKSAIMTSLYGSKAVPRDVFGEGALLDIFYDTMKKSAPAAWELNEAFLAIWDETKLENSWVLPDNFHVHVKVMGQVKETVHFLNEPFDVFFNENIPIKEGRSLGANCIHSIDGMIVREMTRRCDYDPVRTTILRNLIENNSNFGQHTVSTDDETVLILWNHYKNTGYLSARILDHLNINNLGHVNTAEIIEILDSLPKTPFKVISIHDCFRCLPNYGNDLRRQYNLQLELIARSHLLQNIISQLVGRNITVNKMDPKLPRDIRNTNYALS